jgi:hypothetical protein
MTSTREIIQVGLAWSQRININGGRKRIKHTAFTHRISWGCTWGNVSASYEVFLSQARDSFHYSQREMRPSSRDPAANLFLNEPNRRLNHHSDLQWYLVLLLFLAAYEHSHLCDPFYAPIPWLCRQACGLPASAVGRGYVSPWPAVLVSFHLL